MLRSYSPTFTLAAAASILVACSVLFHDPHENFLKINQSEVGKYAWDSNTTPGRIRSSRIGERTLPNGNREIGFRHIRSCRYYYEVEKDTQRIVGWRWEGKKEDCSIPL
jgi:hypothetical protein